MQLNVQREGANNVGVEQIIPSDYGQVLVTLRTLEEEIRLAVHQEGMAIQKAMDEKLQSFLGKFSSGECCKCAQKMTVSERRSLHLKFSDEVSLPVLTGKVLIGKSGEPMTVSLIDSTTGQVVDCGPESSAKVCIFLLHASDDDKDNSWNEGDKTKPHLSKNSCIDLKNGVGTLSNVKLGHDSAWKKSCSCRLGARIVENFVGIRVKEALTESFVVSDRRSKLYKKHPCPSLSDEVWRLRKISKDGKRCKLLNNEKIHTVQDFLFLHSVDPLRLKKIAGATDKIWEIAVDNARSCNIHDKKVYVHYCPRDESKTGVVFDCVGVLKGMVVDESHYVRVENLSADEKACARKLLVSAFENRENRTSFVDEASLQQRYPYKPSDIDAPGNYSNHNEFHAVDHFTVAGSSSLSIYDTNPSFPTSQLPVLECNDGDAPADPSQSIVPGIPTPHHPCNMPLFGSLESRQLNESIPTDVPLYSPSCDFPNFDVIDWIDDLLAGQGILDTCNANGPSETLRELRFCSRSSARSFHFVARVVVNAKLFVDMVRAKRVKRVMALGGIPSPKRQRT